jgi:putative exporter of polyketide antibiotics
MVVVALVAWAASIYFAALPGDEMSVVTALSEFAYVGIVALFVGSLAFAGSILFGRAVGAGIGGGYLFAAYAINGYAGLVPGFDILRLGSVFYWTQAHRPMAGSYDWPAIGAVLALTVLLAVAGVVMFVRRDLGSRVAVGARVRGGRGFSLGLGRLVPVGRWSLSGPGARSLADRLPEAVLWGVAMGAYGLFVSLAADSFAQVINSVPQIAAMVRLFYPDFDFESVGGILQFATFAFISLIVGLAAASLVHGWSADEREGRLELVLASPLRRVAWFLRSTGALLVAVLVMGLVIGLGPAIGAAAQGDEWTQLLGGGLVLGLYGAALVGVGLAVAGLGWPGLAALAVGAFTLSFYLIDLLGALLGLPAEFINLSLTSHLGRPMIGDYDWPGMIACAALALGGLFLGAWRFSRRDLRNSG